MDRLKELMLAADACHQDPVAVLRYFKTSPGSYGAHDKFLGIYYKDQRRLAKAFCDLSQDEISTLLESPYNEVRQIGFFILIHQYQKGGEAEKTRAFQFYLNHIECVNNWNLVDDTAYVIVGDYLSGKGHAKDRKLLTSLAKSKSLWERRIAIVSTLAFIRKNDFAWTLKLVMQLIKDKEDLMHKAMGWMLREVGKRNLARLTSFLDDYANLLPRTSLRYAIRKLPDDLRNYYLRK